MQHSCLFMMHNLTTPTRLNSIKYKSIYRLLFHNCTFLIEPKKLTFEVCVCLCVRLSISIFDQFSIFIECNYVGFTPKMYCVLFAHSPCCCLLFDIPIFSTSLPPSPYPTRNTCQFVALKLSIENIIEI